MMSAHEITPAVRRAMVVLGNQDPGWTRDAIAGALDVEEMARAMRDADCTGHHHGTSACPDRHCRSDTLPGYRKTATALRAAILGGAA